MRLLEAAAILASGVAAGAINTVVGSGTLVTFPTLLAFGYPPVVANVSNTIGLVPGSISGALGYRRELAGQRRRAVRLGAASGVGALCGAAALLILPPSAFRTVVPVFIALALVLVVAGPRLTASLERSGRTRPKARGAAAALGVFVTGVYGGYFGAAQGILLLALLALSVEPDLQRSNALKNVLAGLTNLVAGLLFIAVASVAWGAALLIAAGAVVGAQLGARYGRRLPPRALRGAIVVVGSAAIVRLVAG